MWNSVASLIGGMAGRGPGSPSTRNGSQPSGPGTRPPSSHTLPELAAMATTAELEQSIRNNRHAMAMGAAQLREHYGRNWEEPEDVAISWNSPTTTHHHGGGGVGQLAGGLLLGGLGSLGVAAALGAFSAGPSSPVPAAAAQEWDVTIEAVDGKPTVTSVEVVD